MQHLTAVFDCVSRLGILGRHKILRIGNPLQMEEKSARDNMEYAAYGELRGDIRFIRRNEQLTLAIENIKKSLDITCMEYKNYDSFSFEEKARYDALLTYSVNSLIWMFQKLTGGTNMESIKHELGKVRAAMERTEEVCASATERPKINQPAVKRFIAAGLYDPKARKPAYTPPNKKKRFED